jgi:uncharacterized protein (TIGR02147 family)
MSMNEQMALQIKLRNTFREMQLKNSMYSLRAFAQKLGVSPSALSEIFNGKRSVSRKLAQKILLNMGCETSELEKILKLFPGAEKSKINAVDQNDEVSDYLTLSSDHFQLVSKWYHFAILSLIETKGFRADFLWIAKRLGIKVLEAEQALNRFERLEFISWNRKNKTIKLLSQKQLSSSDELVSDAVRQAHHEDLLMAARKIESERLEDRDFTSLTIAIDKSKLSDAKKMIRDFQDRLAAFLETGTQTEVYKLNFYVFPLSQDIEKTVSNKRGSYAIESQRI